MTGSKRNTVRSSRVRPIMSDLTRVDAHEIRPHEYDEAPDLSDRDLSDGIVEISGMPARRGRPTKTDRKLSTTLRLDPDILDYFKASGPGWQGRINAALREKMERVTSSK